jgi:hypothetical protein
VRARVYACECVCVCARARACARVCVCECARAQQSLPQTIPLPHISHIVTSVRAGGRGNDQGGFNRENASITPVRYTAHATCRAQSDSLGAESNTNETPVGWPVFVSTKRQSNHKTTPVGSLRIRAGELNPAAIGRVVAPFTLPVSYPPACVRKIFSKLNPTALAGL